MMATTEGGALFHTRRVLAEHGPLGFFRGLSVVMAKASLVNAGGFAMLFYTRDMLGLERRMKEERQ